MAQFADYGFPKAHSVAYAYLAFQTGYLKAHYAEHFYAAVLSNEVDDTAKVFRYTKEMRGQGIALLPPDVNESEVGFTALKGAIRYGLAAIKGIGLASVNAIMKAREQGPFRSLFDFTERLEDGAINKRVLEGLVCSGAFDSVKPSDVESNEWRARLYAVIDSALARSTRARRTRALGQDDLFGGQEGTAAVEVSLPNATAWTAIEMLTAEKKALGFYITGHPLDALSETISQLGATTSAELAQRDSGSRAVVAGLIRELQLKTTKKGDRFAIFRLEDQAGSVKCVLWPEPYRRNSSILMEEATILITGRAEISDEGAITLIAERVNALTEAVQQKARELVIRISGAQINGGARCEAVKAILEGAAGDCDVFLEIVLDDMTVRVRAHPSLKVQGSAEIESALRSMDCEVTWEGFSARAAAAHSF